MTAVSRKWIPWLAGAGLIAVVAICAIFFSTHRARALTEKDSVVLAEFVNTTGDPVFDGTLNQALAVQLEQSPYLNLLPESKIQDALRMMGRKPDERVTRDLAKEISQRENAKAVISGTIASLGNDYVITLEATNAQTGDSLARQQVEATGKEQVLKSLDKAASDLRQKLGESLSSVQQYTTPLEQATTSSLEALKEYSAGMAFHNRLEEPSALPHLKRAVELDPNFASAYATLGTVTSNSGSHQEGMEYIKKAYDLRERASEREKLYIETHYCDMVTGNLEKAEELYLQWIHAYPRDSRPLTNLSLIYSDLGEWDKALADSTEDLRVAPDDVFGYQNQMAAYLGLNRFDEAKTVAETAISRHRDTTTLHLLLASLASLENDDAAMQTQANWFAGRPTEANFVFRVAVREDSLGKIKQSRETGRRVVALANKAGFREMPTNLIATQSVRDGAHGFVESARQKAAEVLQLTTDERSAHSQAALAFAQIGDAAQSQKLIDELNRDFPEDTSIRYRVSPTVQAFNLLHGNKAADTIAILEPTRKYELGAPISNFTFLTMYIRGLAYLQLHDGAKAAAEFQRILDHRGLNSASPYLPLAQLNLARAYAQQGNSATARTAYQDFFGIWKDADPDIPVLREAKAEYSKLQ